MPKRKLPKPPIAEYPFYKAILLALFVGAGIFLLGIGFTAAVRGTIMITAGHVVVGVVTFVHAILNWLSWRPRRSYTFRWITSLAGHVYASCLLLLVALSYWNALLNSGWSTFVNVILVGLFIMAWFLPMISASIARQLAGMQDNFDLFLLKLGTPARLILLILILIVLIGGAEILGLGANLEPSMVSRVIVVAFLSSYASIGLAQYAADHLWPYRPWAKEDE